MTKSVIYIKTSNINLKETNRGKITHLSYFLKDYRYAMSKYIEYYWSKHNLDGNHTKEQLASQTMYPYSKNVEFDTILSGRALKCAATQAMGMINAALRKQQKRMYQLSVMQRTELDSRKYKNLQKKIATTRLVKPTVNKEVGAELNSIVIKSHNSTTKHFDVLFQLASLFNDSYKKLNLTSNKIRILGKKHRHYNKLEEQCLEVKPSFLVTEKYITTRFAIKKPDTKTKGTTVGIDQGVTDLISLVSDSGSNWTSSINAHGHDLRSIMKQMTTSKKGSHRYRRLQSHRKNYIHWAINQINLNPIKEVRMEHLVNMGFKQKTSGFLRRFTNTIIEDKLQDICMTNGVHFVLQSSPYRSQRCSSCGFVHTKNRKGKQFKCKRCNHNDDADLNAASNHLVDLPHVDRYMVRGLNRTLGFYWLPEFDGVCSPSK